MKGHQLVAKKGDWPSVAEAVVHDGGRSALGCCALVWCRRLSVVVHLGKHRTAVGCHAAGGVVGSRFLVPLGGMQRWVLCNSSRRTTPTAASPPNAPEPTADDTPAA